MATVHPSRLGLVPGALTPRTTPPNVPTSLPVVGVIREQELRRQLLERRKSKSQNGSGNRGKELLPETTSRDTSVTSSKGAQTDKEDDDSGAERQSKQPSSNRDRHRAATRDHDEEYGVESRRAHEGTSHHDRRRRDDDYRYRRERSRERRHEPHRHDERSSRLDDARRHREDSREREDYRRDSRRRHEEESLERSSLRAVHDERREIKDVESHKKFDLPRRPSPYISRSPVRRNSHPSPPREHQKAPSTSNYGYGPSASHVTAPFRPPPIDLVRGAPPPPFLGPPVHMARPPPRYFGGPVDYERRRMERENNPLSIWPPSPKAPYLNEEELEAERRAKHKIKRHKRHYDTESSSDSEDERRRRRRRERRKKYSDSEDSEDYKKEKRRKHRSVTRERTRTRSPNRMTDGGIDGEEWVEKRDESLSLGLDENVGVLLNEEDEEVGPQLPRDGMGRERRVAYRDMLPGEGEAMAFYASTGQRIPRRGEIGLDAKDIEQYESSGYVMSGSRHRRMNAVRLRKENQVINAEEKRAILKLQKEENIKKEGMIISQFKEMMDENLQKQGLDKI
ncbi:hypothetical protein M231_07422 [Tremella mesenterica]|uniref:NF-kappa-B-activating protein C-terminal domain-containing protein n=1 Tax=Tremella mesenterica TaxID=5217 RepID=A0A4Q1B964_TREME|nr:hypothetical protein M231_07422 [Tremella mesenterica]